jgi:hypothetical protein
MADQEESDNQLETQIEVLSNSGWNSLIFDFKKTFMVNNKRMILATLSVEGNFWNREYLLFPIEEDELANRYELTNDYKVYLPQVILSEERIKEYHGCLESWLAKPFEFQLALSDNSETDTEISVSIGPRDDIISKIDHPVFSLNYNSFHMKAKWCFVTDYTCINLTLQGLNSWFKLPVDRM